MNFFHFYKFKTSTNSEDIFTYFKISANKKLKNFTIITLTKIHFVKSNH